jgi:NADH-quinone oxidoreductase subunit L
VVGVFVTALYTFRLFFLVFHGKERLDEDARHHVHESPWVITVPLVLLAIPSVVIGWPTIRTVLFGNYFEGAIAVHENHNVLSELGHEFAGPGSFLLHGLIEWPFILALAGVATAWYAYLVKPTLPDLIRQRVNGLYTLLVRKYFFDDFNERVLARGGRAIGGLLWRIGDVAVIDGAFVNGSAKLVGWLSQVSRYRIQSGFLYSYAFAMIIGLAAVIGWLLTHHAG